MDMIETAVFSKEEGAGWTTLGQVIPDNEAKDPAAIARRLGAEYEVETRPVFIKLSDGSYAAIPDRAAVVRNDNDHVTGIVSQNRYGTAFRQPKDILEAFRDDLAKASLTISHAAILAGGSRIAVCALLPDDFSFSVGSAKDQIKRYITLSTGYDGKHGTLQSDGTLRVVCWNTLEWSIVQAMNAGKLRGIAASQKLQPDTLKKLVAGLAGDLITANNASSVIVPDEKVELPVFGQGISKSLAATIARVARSTKAQKAAFNEMANHKIGAIELTRYFANVLEIDVSQLNHVNPDGRPAISTKSKNMLSALAAAYDSSPGSQWAHGNVWGALNAVTYYASHAKTVRDTSGAGLGAARYASNLDGDAARIKARALVLAQSLVKVAA